MHATDYNTKVIQDLVAFRSDVLHLHCALAPRLEGAARRTVKAIALLHARRNAELSELADRLGTPVDLTFKPRLSTRLVSYVPATERRLLRRLEHRQAELVTAYRAALQDPQLPQASREMLLRQLSELIRHKTWLAFRAAQRQHPSAVAKAA